MVIMGGKDGTKAVRDLNVVNIGTDEEPEYALVCSIAGADVNNKIVKIIDNEAIETTNEPADIDFKLFQNFLVTYKLGAAVGGTPTLTITLQIKDANGNVISDTDYVTSALAAESQGIAFKGYMEAYSTIQVLCTLGGTGTFAASDVILEMKS